MRILTMMHRSAVATWVMLHVHIHIQELIPLQNVTKGDIAACVKSGMSDLNDLKCKTKAGTGCGGCMPLVTNIFKVQGLVFCIGSTI